MIRRRPDPNAASPGRRLHFRRGIRVAGGLALALAIVLVAGLAMSYDGRCGGFFSGLSAPHPCSWWQYLSGDGLAIVLVLGATYWPVPLLVVLPPAVGYWRDRRG